MEMLTGDTFVGVLEGDEMTRNLNERLKKDIILVAASGRSDPIGLCALGLRVLAGISLLLIQNFIHFGNPPAPDDDTRTGISFLERNAGLFTRATKVTITE